MTLADFLLYHIVGLWTGDDDKELIQATERGADVLQGPRVIIDVTVSQEGEVQPQ